MPSRCGDPFNAVDASSEVPKCRASCSRVRTTSCGYVITLATIFVDEEQSRIVDGGSSAVLSPRAARFALLGQAGQSIEYGPLIERELNRNVTDAEQRWRQTAIQPAEAVLAHDPP